MACMRRTPGSRDRDQCVGKEQRALGIAGSGSIVGCPLRESRPSLIHRSKSLSKERRDIGRE